MSKIVCPCGMPLHITHDGEPVVPWSPRWHQAHYDRHLDVFPDCDARSRNNLAAMLTEMD